MNHIHLLLYIWLAANKQAQTLDVWGVKRD